MTPEDAFRAGAVAALNQLLPMVPVGAEKTARQWVAALSLPPETQEGAKKIEDQAWHEARRRRLYPLAYKNAPPAPASPRQEDREALLDYIIWQILDVDREDAASMGDQLRAAGYQRIPDGHVVVPAEPTEVMRESVAGFILGFADPDETPERRQAFLDGIIRAALSPKDTPDA